MHSSLSWPYDTMMLHMLPSPPTQILDQDKDQEPDACNESVLNWKVTPKVPDWIHVTWKHLD